MFSKPLIVVATDLTETSAPALRAAEKIRRLTDGKIIAIHVLKYPEEWDWIGTQITLEELPQNYQSDLMTSTRVRLSEQLKKCGTTAEKEIRIGLTVPELVKFLEMTDPDLFLMGHRARGGLFRLTGIAERIIPKIKVPAMVLSQEFETAKIAGLLDPYLPEKSIFSVTEELAYLLSSEVEFVSVCPGDKYIAEKDFEGTAKVVKLSPKKRREFSEKMKSFMQVNSDPHLKPQLHSSVATGDSLVEVVGVLNDDRIQLAVIGRHQRAILEKIFLKSFSRRMVNEWKGNLMILPPAS